jgi:hypothetical protein
MQNEQQYLPPLLLDALGGGKRPTQNPNTPLTQYKQRIHSRSRSRERSQTPPTYGSPTSQNAAYNDEDIPPVISQHHSSPTRKNEPPSLNLQHSNLYNDALSPQSKTPLSTGISFHGNSPSAMSVEYSSPRSKQEQIRFPNTPTPIANGATVTLIGIPKHQQEFIVDSFTEFGPITNITKSEKVDANWIVITYLHSSSVEKALSFDGKMFDQSWILIVRAGDCFGVLEEKMIHKKKNCSIDGEEPSTSEMPFELKKKTRLVLSEQALVTPVQTKVTRFAQMDIQEKVDPNTGRSFHQSLTETSIQNERIYPEVSMEDDLQPAETGWSSSLVSHTQDRNIIASGTELTVRPAGLLSKISDFLFGW